MLKIGITGGIGSGKTTVCKVFELLGVPVFYADDVAKSVMHTDPVLREAIIKTFGTESYSTQGELNRAYISSIVFKNQAELNKLNALVHPVVFRAFDHWTSKQTAAYVIKEAALLFESKSYEMCDQTILVLTPEATRIQRVMERDKITELEVRARMNRQWTDDEKKKLAGHILLNDETQLLIPKIIRLHQQFNALAAIE